MTKKIKAELPAGKAGKLIKEALKATKTSALTQVEKDDLIQRTIRATLHAAANTAVNVINKSPIANSDAAAYMKTQMLKEIPICCGIAASRRSPGVDIDPVIVISLDNGNTTSLPASSFTVGGHCKICLHTGTEGARFGFTSGINHALDCVVGNAIHAAYEEMSGHTIMKG